MQILNWVRHHQPASVRQVWAHFRDIDGRARTTVLTLVESLRKKGFLERKDVGGVWEYYVPEPGEIQEQHLLGSFIDFALGGDRTPLVQNLVASSEKLTSDQIEELRALVEKLDSES